MKQVDLGLNLTTKRTRKREFLAEMERVVPWAALVELITHMHPRENVVAALRCGDQVRRSKRAREISQEALADIAGMDRSYVGGAERGEHNLAVMNLLRIATALDLRPS